MLADFLMKILERISLAEVTTFRIGGPARFFVTVKNEIELKEALQFSRDKKIPFFILGGGSNILVSDAGFPGLVIKMELSGIEILSEDKKSGHILVAAGAGENWDTFVVWTVERGFGGLENLSLIPGTVGATPIQNIGAYGVEVRETIVSVETLEATTGRQKVFSNVECQFGYRDSFFKKPKGKKYVVTRVIFSLTKVSEVRGSVANYSLKTDYNDIQEAIKIRSTNADSNQDLSIKKIRDIVIDIRARKLPDVKKVGTAGSFFKNPIIAREEFERLKKEYPDMPSFPVEVDRSTHTTGKENRMESGTGEAPVKIPAAWFLDKLCGFKGFREGSVGVYQNQALVLVNFGQATAAQILDLAKQMTDCVREKTGIELEREVELIQSLSKANF